MATHVGLIRGINVGGKNRLQMSDLRAFLADIGFEGAKTHLQSGNFVFSSQGRSSTQLETRLQAEFESRLGMSTAFFVRTQEDWSTIVANNPYPNRAVSDPSHLMLIAVRHAPTDAEIGAVQARYQGTEQISVAGGHIYAFCPDGIGTSKLLGTSAWNKCIGLSTARNWNTVLALLSLVHCPEPA